MKPETLEKYAEMKSRIDRGEMAKDVLKGVNISGYYKWKRKNFGKSFERKANKKAPSHITEKAASLGVSKSAARKREAPAPRLETISLDEPSTGTTGKLFMFVGTVEQFRSLVGGIA